MLIAEPGQPEKPECVTRDRNQIEVKWNPPRSDGGNAIEGYVVERREKGAKRREWSQLNHGHIQKVN